MKVLILDTQEITSKKDGKKYTLLKAISTNSEPLTIFLNAEQAAAYPIPQTKIVPQGIINDLFADEKNRVVDVSFNQRGGLESIAF